MINWFRRHFVELLVMTGFLLFIIFLGWIYFVALYPVQMQKQAVRYAPTLSSFQLAERAYEECIQTERFTHEECIALVGRK